MCLPPPSRVLEPAAGAPGIGQSAELLSSIYPVHKSASSAYCDSVPGAGPPNTRPVSKTHRVFRGDRGGWWWWSWWSGTGTKYRTKVILGGDKCSGDEMEGGGQGGSAVEGDSEAKT